MNGSLAESSHFPVTDPPTSQDEFNEGEQSAKLWDCNDLPWGPKSGALSMDHQVNIFTEHGHSSLNTPSCLGGLLFLPMPQTVRLPE